MKLELTPVFKSFERKYFRIKNIPPKKIFLRIVAKISKKKYHYLNKRARVRNKKKSFHNEFINFKSDSVFLDLSQNCYVESTSNANEVMEDAIKICNHTFSLLGSGEVTFSEKIPWKKDFKTGYTWTDEYYNDIKIIDLSNDSDVKVPWEISRFQHLFTLGKAYYLSNDEKFALEFQQQIEDWNEQNPFEMSVNWTCTMDVSIRAVNLIVASSFFKDSKSIDDDFWGKFNSLLYEHGIYIFRNLENEGYHTGNHYLSNVVGLVWLGIYFKNIKNRKVSKKARKWMAFGLKELEKEMFIQTNDDGTNYEASTSYHRLVTEFFLFTVVFCNKNNINFSDSFMKRLELMIDFIANITKPNGEAPIIGDADDGRLLIPNNYFGWNKKDFRYLLGVSGHLFQRADFQSSGVEFTEEVLWINGFRWTNSSYGKHFEKSVKYEDGGYYVLKNNLYYVHIRCGELSFRGEGTHSHNDQLSFELNIQGKDFVIDPGTYTYTSNYRMRNLFRSTRQHSTLQLNNIEQNTFEDLDLFHLPERTYANCDYFSKDKFSGRHFGYLNELGKIHERKIQLLNQSVYVQDLLHDNWIEKNKFTSTIRFILHPNVEIVKSIPGEILLKNDDVFALFTYSYNDCQLILSDIDISPSYGVILPSKKIELISSSKENIVEFSFINSKE